MSAARSTIQVCMDDSEIDALAHREPVVKTSTSPFCSPRSFKEVATEGDVYSVGDSSIRVRLAVSVRRQRGKGVKRPQWTYYSVFEKV